MSFVESILIVAQEINTMDLNSCLLKGYFGPQATVQHSGRRH